MTAHQIIMQLTLMPHPEGGWYREFYRSATRVATASGERSAVTSIHYLLEHRQSSRWHVVQADEIWHFCDGAPLELLAYDSEDTVLTRYSLSNLQDDTRVAVVPRTHWQAAHTRGDYSLVSCTVAPGFEFADFQFVQSLPQHRAHFDAALEEYTALL